MKPDWFVLLEEERLEKYEMNRHRKDEAIQKE